MDVDRAESFGAADRADWFRTTHWSVILAAARDESPQSRVEALEKLCHTYWYPLYAFIRRKGHTATEAEDLTQEFFARLLRGSFPSGIKPQGGKFRSYLLTALQHFLTNEWESARAQKRGGDKVILSWQRLNAEDRYRNEPADEVTPEILFDRRWASVLLERVRRQLAEECSSDGKADVFKRLQPCLTGAEPMMPYADLARQMDVSESAVKMSVHRLRKRYGELLRQEISQTVASPKDVEEEIRSLLAAL